MNSGPSKLEQVQDLRDSSHSAQFQAVPETSTNHIKHHSYLRISFTQSTEHYVKLPSCTSTYPCSMLFNAHYHVQHITIVYSIP